MRSAGGRPAKTAAGMVWMRATQVAMAELRRRMWSI
jgi:hypothetical protein